MSRALIIGSRRSKLAMTQSESVARTLSQRGGVECRIVPVETEGDRVSDKPLPEIGGKGLFTQALEERLLGGEIDLAVHSLKDLPGEIPDGLAVGAIARREDARDVLISRSSGGLEGLPPGARIGTGSARRAAQLKRLRGNVELVDIRGNVDTRLAKLDAGDYDAIVLAAAGLIRLGLAARASVYFDTEEIVPAPGQGALGIECRSDDKTTRALLRAHLHDAATATCCQAERRIMSALQAGCSAPFGAHAAIVDGTVMIRSFVGSVGGESIRAERSGPQDEAANIADALVSDLFDRGARDIIEQAS